jgi:hypothetical protein
MIILLGLAQLIAAQEVIVISNGGSASVTKAELEQYFLGKKTSLGNNKVVIATLKTGAAHETFMKEYMGKMPDQFLMYWKQLVFTGRGTMPKSFENDKELIAFIAKTPGAIGYVASGSKGELTPEITIVTVK